MIHLISQSNSQDLFEKIKKNNESNLGGFPTIYCHKTRFANNEISVTLDESVRNKTVAIIAQPKDYEDNFELFMTIDAAKRASAKEIIAVIPFLPHSRQERRPSGQRTTISAKLYADMLQAAGLDRLITVDLHTTAIEGFYNIPVDNLDTVHTFCNDIKMMMERTFDIVKNPILVSPDMGGVKRVKEYAKKLMLPIAVLYKERLKENEVGDMFLMGEVKDHDVIIIDDMIDTGGTIAKSIEVLQRKGAKSIRVMATHGLFSDNGYERLLETEGIEEIIVSNSLPQKNAYKHTGQKTEHNILKEKSIDFSIKEILLRLEGEGRNL